MTKYPEQPFLTTQEDQLHQAPQKTEELPVIEIVMYRNCITDISSSNCDDCLNMHIMDTGNNLVVNQSGNQEI